MQTPLQATWPAAHVARQTPFWHVVPDAQTLPALAPVQSPVAPQYALFVVGSMHFPPQLTSPATHVSWQLPFVHTLPLGQAVPAFAPVQSPEAPQ